MVENKRHNYVMKDFMVPIVTALIIGTGASFLTMKFNEGQTMEWRRNIETQIEGMKVIMRAVQTNQIEIASRRVWMDKTDEELKEIRGRLTNLEESRAKVTETEARHKAILREIDLLRKEVRDK